MRGFFVLCSALKEKLKDSTICVKMSIISKELLNLCYNEIFEVTILVYKRLFSKSIINWSVAEFFWSVSENQKKNQSS